MFPEHLKEELYERLYEELIRFYKTIPFDNDYGCFLLRLGNRNFGYPFGLKTKLSKNQLQVILAVKR